MSPFTKTLITGTVVGALAGCSSWFKQEEPEVTAVPVAPVQVQSLTYGVTHFDDRHDFVIYESGYEHVVLPTGRSVMYRKDWDEDRLVHLAKALDAKDKAQPNSKAAPKVSQKSTGSSTRRSTDNKSRPESSDYTDPREQAWAKLCRDEIDQLTEGDWFLILSAEMPDSLRSWCDEETARGNIK